MFRATPSGIANRSVNLNQQHFSAIAKLQRQLSSGLRFERASEAPLDAARVSSLRETLQNLNSDRVQVPAAQRVLNQSVSTLVEIQNITNRAKQISLDAFQQNDDDGSKILADEVDGLIERLELLVDSKFDGQYLFSGTGFEKSPIQFTEHQQLPLPSVAYTGSPNRASIGISSSITIDTRYSASEFIFGKQRSASLYFGETGAKPGVGTDSGVGRAYLDVIHQQTNFAGASGVIPGTDSVERDTIVGPPGSHTLTISDTSGTGTTGTISLNGGQPIAFSSADTNLEVTGPRGEKIFVDTTSITPGFDDTIDIESLGNISTDGGNSTTAIDFSNNQIVTNQLTDQVTNVNTSEIREVGREHVEYSGTADLFTALHELKNDLLNERNLGVGERNDSFARRTADIDRASEGVLRVIGLQSVSLQSLEAIDKRQASQKLELQIDISNIQSVDLAQAATELQNRHTLVQTNFASLSIVQNLSILNFLG